MRSRLALAALVLPLLAACQATSTATPTSAPTTDASPTASAAPSMPATTPTEQTPTAPATTTATPTPTGTAASPTAKPTTPAAAKAVARPAFRLAVPPNWRENTAQRDSASQWRAQIEKGSDGNLDIVRVEASKATGKKPADATAALEELLLGGCPSGAKAPDRTIAGQKASGVTCAEGELKSEHYLWVANGRLYTAMHMAEGRPLDRDVFTRVLQGLTLVRR